MHLGIGLRTMVLLAGGVLLLPGTAAPAAPLDEKTCAMLRNERLHLELAGVRDSMANGPAWAVTKLPAARLNDIKRLIELDEQVTFRCPEAEAIVAAADGSVVIPLPMRNPKAKAAVPPPRRKAGTGH